VNVSVPTKTQILQIAYTDPSPLVAQRNAQAIAEAYLDFKTNQAMNTYEAIQRNTAKEIRKQQTLIDRAQATLNHSQPGSPAADQAQNDISIASGQIALLRSQVSTAGALDIDPGAVIQQSNLPAHPSSPNHLRNVALGLFLGIALGVGLAFLRERLDDRLRDREDLEEHIGAPALVAIPKVADWRDRAETRLVSISEPRGAATEAYKTLRTSILFNAAQTGLRTVMICSATAGEGKTTTAANLATVLAQAGKRVILVSADLRKPRVRRFFEVEGHTIDHDRGLSNVLTGTESLQEALQPTMVKGLWLLDSGPVPANPAEMAQSQAMATLLEALRESADFTIIDSAPALVVTDALAMAPHVDGILYVAAAGTTTRQAISRARVQLDQVGGRVIGAVLNGFDPSKSGAYTYEYSYRYVYRYQDEETGERRIGAKS